MQIVADNALILLKLLGQIRSIYYRWWNVNFHGCFLSLKTMVNRLRFQTVRLQLTHQLPQQKERNHQISVSKVKTLLQEATEGVSQSQTWNFSSHLHGLQAWEEFQQLLVDLISDISYLK